MIEHALANPIVTQLLGLVIGLFTSFFSWWVLFRLLTPKIVLSESISKTVSDVPIDEDEDKSGYRYRIKFENAGSRSVIDLETRSFVRIKGLVDPASAVWEIVHIPMNPDGEKRYSIPLMRPVRKSKLRTRLRICPNHSDYCTKPHFPQQIREKAFRKALTLEDLLSSGSDAEFVVVAAGYDELTGARKVFIKTYSAKDIKLGRFERNGLAVVEQDLGPCRGVTGAKHDHPPS